MFSIIVAMGENREIGKDNGLLWHIPEDLQNFKKITTGKTVIMGRRTFESIGKPLPRRENVVISRTLSKLKERELGIKIFNSLEEVIKKYGKKKNDGEEVFVIGGEQIYREILEKDLADRLYISHIKYSDFTADAYFPDVNLENWELIEKREYEGWKFSLYEKKELKIGEEYAKN